MRATSWNALAALALAAIACERKPEQRAQKPSPGAQTPVAQQQPSTPAEGGTPAPDSGPILIGEVGSLTGPEATFGISTRNGVDLAIRQENAAGGVRGRQLAVRVYDDQGKPEEAANAATRLISQDRVLVIIGEVDSSNSLAMAPKAQEGKVPMITPSSTNPRVTEVGDYIFRVCFTDAFQGYVMAKFARENLKARTAAILEDQKSDYSLGLADVFSQKFSEFGGKIVAVEAYAKGDSDFRSQLTNVKRLKPDALYVPGYYTEVGLIARQARELAFKTTMLGGDGWESARLFELGGSAVEGSYFSNHYSPEDPTPHVQKFVQDYKSEYGEVPDSLAALGYDATRVAIQALRQAKQADGPSIRDAIARTKDFPGVAGTITIDEKRNAVKPAVVLKVTGGKTEVVASVAP
ncbi:MAG TPA: ABC transporter substrate-binding protein [Myxococcaceae bacterium]|nr:ABC transporter substrate-binding protein [Myxococcaceae bacterium]